MSHHHLPPGAFVLIAPVATAMLFHDLRRRAASVKGPDIAQDEHPLRYWFATCFNMALVFFSWWMACDAVARWWSR